MKTITILRLFRALYRFGDRLDEILSRLDSLESNQNFATKQYLTKQEAARYLGKTNNFVDNLVRSREVSYYQPTENGYSVYISKAELDRWITKIRYRSKKEINGMMK